MTIFRSICLSFLLVFLPPVTANAVIIDLPDASGLGYFQDTGTGYTWMDVDNFFGMSYTSIETAIQGTGFQIATLAQIQQLHGSLAFADYFSWNVILGDSDRGNTNIVWGFYDIGSGIDAGESWMYSDLATNGNGTQWNYSTIGVPGYFGPYSISQASTATDRGAWIVRTSASVPVPGTLALLGLGFFGMAAMRRKLT